VTKDVLKENIYSAYFPPADLVVETGNRFQGTFMWDTKSAKIYFSQKPFEEFRKAELQKAIEHYGK